MTHRRSKYAKDQFLEQFMASVNEELGGLEDRLIRQAEGNSYKTVVIVGQQRSGTTLLNQLMLKHFSFFYPNNMMARYWKTPVVGTLLSEVFGQYLSVSKHLKSDLGYTTDLGGPHEFGYFWRQYFPTGRVVDSDYVQARVDLYAKLADTLRAISIYARRPLLFKNIVQLGLNLPALYQVLPEVVCIVIERDPYYVAQSTYLSRKKLYGTADNWLGLRPSGYEDVAGWPPLKQVAWQVNAARQEMDEQHRSVPQGAWTSLSYEGLVAEPRAELEKIERFLEQNDVGLRANLDSLEKRPLRSGNVHRLDKTEADELKMWLHRV